MSQKNEMRDGMKDRVERPAQVKKAPKKLGAFGQFHAGIKIAGISDCLTSIRT